MHCCSHKTLPLQAERSKAQAELSEAREILRELKAQIDDKELTLNPYQAEKKAAFQERETQREKRHASLYTSTTWIMSLEMAVLVV